MAGLRSAAIGVGAVLEELHAHRSAATSGAASTTRRAGLPGLVIRLSEEGSKAWVLRRAIRALARTGAYASPGRLGPPSSTDSSIPGALLWRVRGEPVARERVDFFVERLEQLFRTGIRRLERHIVRGPDGEASLRAGAVRVGHHQGL